MQSNARTPLRVRALHRHPVAADAGVGTARKVPQGAAELSGSLQPREESGCTRGSDSPPQERPRRSPPAPQPARPHSPPAAGQSRPPAAPRTAVQPGDLGEPVGADKQVQGNGHRAPLHVLEAAAQRRAWVHLPGPGRGRQGSQPGSAGGAAASGEGDGGTERRKERRSPPRSAPAAPGHAGLGRTGDPPGGCCCCSRRPPGPAGAARRRAWPRKRHPSTD